MFEFLYLFLRGYLEYFVKIRNQPFPVNLEYNLEDVNNSEQYWRKTR